MRAHQQRKKYRELLSTVGVLEKVMLRWYRKGVGLRGFSSGVMPIDDDVEEDAVKFFRKQRVETAINEAVSRVSCIIGSPKAMQQYRRMLQRYQQAKVNILSLKSTDSGHLKLANQIVLIFMAKITLHEFSEKKTLYMSCEH